MSAYTLQGECFKPDGVKKTKMSCVTKIHGKVDNYL